MWIICRVHARVRYFPRPTIGCQPSWHSGAVLICHFPPRSHEENPEPRNHKRRVLPSSCGFSVTSVNSGVKKRNRTPPAFSVPLFRETEHSRPVTSVIFPRTHHRALIMMSFAFQLAMDHLGLCLLVQLSLAFGVAGLLWPDKFMPLFDVLMFPWAASYRAVRANSLAAIGLSLVLLVKLFTAAV